jgi:hypothetical protein
MQGVRNKQRKTKDEQKTLRTTEGKNGNGQVNKEQKQKSKIQTQKYVNKREN